MLRYLVLFLALSSIQLCASADLPSAEPDLIGARIVELIDIGRPVFLDIQAGDLTSILDYKVRQMLLEKGADLREQDPESGADYFTGTGDTLSDPSPLPYALAAANLVKVSMELGGTTIERKSFLSYRSERFPLYTFQVRQISLPEYRLEQIDSLGFIDQSRKTDDQPLTSIKWFEPVLASTALATLIYLLWTTE